MRTELLGLEKLPELPNEEKEKMSALGILEKPKPMLEGPHGKLETSIWIFFVQFIYSEKAKNIWNNLPIFFEVT